MGEKIPTPYHWPSGPCGILRGTGFAACAGKHYFVIVTKAAFWRMIPMLACLRGSSNLH